MLRTTAEIICWVQLLTLSVEIICWEQLFSPSVEISCWDDILRTTAEIICWVQLLKLYVETICSDYLLIWSVEFNGPAKTCLKPMSIATASPKSFQNPYVLLQNMNLCPVTSIKPMQVQVNTKNIQKTHSFPQLLQNLFLKTHANKSEYKRIFKKPTAFLSFCRFFSLKPRRITANTQKPHPTPESNFFPFEPPALRSTSLPRSHSIACTHARTTRTRNETYFPIGLSWRFFPPNLRSEY